MLCFNFGYFLANMLNWRWSEPNLHNNKRMKQGSISNCSHQAAVSELSAQMCSASYHLCQKMDVLTLKFLQLCGALYQAKTNAKG